MFLTENNSKRKMENNHLVSTLKEAFNREIIMLLRFLPASLGGDEVHNSVKFVVPASAGPIIAA